MMTPSGSGVSLGELEASAVLAAEDLLARDNVPDENQQRDCFSCGETLTGLFCHSCGQKNDDYRRSIWSLFAEAFSSIFSLENRMWRTWVMLFKKPGRVSREFSDGKRTAWTSPVRIYLALSIILFGYMSLTETRIFSVRTDIVAKAGFEGPVENLDDTQVELIPDFGFFRLQSEIDKLNEGTDFNRVSRLIIGEPRAMFTIDDDLTALSGLPDDKLLVSSKSWPSQEDIEEDKLDEFEAKSLAIAAYTERVRDALQSYNDLLSTKTDDTFLGDQAIKAIENGEDFDLLSVLELSDNPYLNQLVTEKVIPLDQELTQLGLTRSKFNALPTEVKNNLSISLGTGQIGSLKLSETDIQKFTTEILRNPAPLNEGISRYLPRFMFLMMPFAAVIGLIFIRGKKTALLYDHLVHATYIHAVTFAFLLILILMSQWTPLRDLDNVFLLGVAIYLPLSAKGMFQRGWFKSILASYGVASVYGLVMFILITVLTAQSVTEAIKAGQI